MNSSHSRISSIFTGFSLASLSIIFTYSYNFKEEFQGPIVNYLIFLFSISFILFSAATIIFAYNESSALNLNYYEEYTSEEKDKKLIWLAKSNNWGVLFFLMAFEVLILSILIFSSYFYIEIVKSIFDLLVGIISEILPILLTLGISLISIIFLNRIGKEKHSEIENEQINFELIENYVSILELGDYKLENEIETLEAIRIQLLELTPKSKIKSENKQIIRNLILLIKNYLDNEETKIIDKGISILFLLSRHDVIKKQIRLECSDKLKTMYKEDKIFSNSEQLYINIIELLYGMGSLSDILTEIKNAINKENISLFKEFVRSIRGKIINIDDKYENILIFIRELRLKKQELDDKKKDIKSQIENLIRYLESRKKEDFSKT